MNRILAAVAVVIAAVLLAACGSPNHPAQTVKKLPPSVKQACPEALQGQGTMGECLPAKPQQVAPQEPAAGGAVAVDFTLEAPFVAIAASSVTGATFPDFSNNDPCVCGAELRAHGHVGEIDKVNQGVGFTDQTFAPMVRDAKAHRLCVGGYDFDQEYTAAEAYKFVALLEAAGIRRGTPCTFPPTLDVEFGLASRAGLEHQLAVLKRAFHRAQIYTGAWYWLPHFGCWVPQGVSFWLSGYPIASLLCGLSATFWAAHQFTDHGATGARAIPYADLSVYRGSPAGFRVYTQQSKPAPTHRQLQEQLWRLYRERTGVRALIATRHQVLVNHDCWHRRTRGCRTVKGLGNESHRHLDAIEAAIRQLHQKGI